MKRMIVAVGLLGLCLGMVWVFGGAFGKNVREVPFMLRGQQAPQFDLPTLNDRGRISLEGMKGKPVVMNVWASWCGPCVVEHPVLEWGSRRYGDRAHFVGLVFEDDEEAAKGFLRKHGQSFPQMFDERGRTAVDYAVAGVPETYFIDADGVIVDKHVGPLSREALAARINKHFGPAAAVGSAVNANPGSVAR